MRPLVYLESNYIRDLENEQEKIRSLIKRKVMAKDLFGNKNNFAPSISN